MLIGGVLFVAAATAQSDSWLVRLRAIDVVPDTSSSTISVIGGHVNHISSQVTPELDFSYFFTKNIAAELILATTRHSVTAHNTALGSVNLGKVSVLPPTLTAQYHFLPKQRFNPYAGVGINVTHFYNVNSGPVATSIHYRNAVGPALQLGADFQLNDNWSLNIDAKKVFMSSDVTVYTPLATLNTNVRINPWIFGLGVGYRFC